ncbi:MAG: hypothetical protein KTV68_06435 [Acidimicrobiia bacterium]|nr:hypothetical protein [Acidimicrobiia bacterium]MCY4435019.1 hypothetical protein [bacterium]
MSIEHEILDRTLQRIRDDHDLSDEVIVSLREQLSMGEKPETEKLIAILTQQEESA